MGSINSGGWVSRSLSTSNGGGSLSRSSSKSNDRLGLTQSYARLVLVGVGGRGLRRHMLKSE